MGARLGMDCPSTLCGHAALACGKPASRPIVKEAISKRLGRRIFDISADFTCDGGVFVGIRRVSCGEILTMGPRPREYKGRGGTVSGSMVYYMEA
jgi:hypothetical protein